MIQIERSRDRNLIVIRASGILTTQDYERAIPEIKQSLELSGGPTRVMLWLEDLQAIEFSPLWRETQFDLKQRGVDARVALIGEKDLEDWAVAVAAPFAKAEMRFFVADREDEGLAWLAVGEKQAGEDA